MTMGNQQNVVTTKIRWSDLQQAIQNQLPLNVTDDQVQIGVTNNQLTVYQNNQILGVFNTQGQFESSSNASTPNPQARSTTDRPTGGSSSPRS